MHYLLFYEGDHEWVTKRAQYRDVHLNAAWKASDRGEILLAGALKNLEDGTISGAVLLFSSDSPKVAEEFAKTDPYVLNGIVRHWYVKEWVTVAGREPATPVRPEAGD